MGWKMFIKTVTREATLKDVVLHVLIKFFLKIHLCFFNCSRSHLFCISLYIHHKPVGLHYYWHRFCLNNSGYHTLHPVAPLQAKFKHK